MITQATGATSNIIYTKSRSFWYFLFSFSTEIGTRMVMSMRSMASMVMGIFTKHSLAPLFRLQRACEAKERKAMKVVGIASTTKYARESMYFIPLSYHREVENGGVLAYYVLVKAVVAQW